MAPRRRTRQPVDANGELVASDLERAFDTLWLQLDGPPLFAEYHFAPGRDWRFDRCHPYARIAVEIDGGTWSGGRHTRGAGFRDDCIKLNAAASRGWLVYRLTSDMLRDDPALHLQPIIDKINDLMDEGGNEDG
jgi:very-short-patch-repair endonuclease